MRFVDTRAFHRFLTFVCSFIRSFACIRYERFVYWIPLCILSTKKRHWLISLCDIFTSCYTRKRVRPLSYFFPLVSFFSVPFSNIPSYILLHHNFFFQYFLSLCSSQIKNCYFILDFLLPWWQLPFRLHLLMTTSTVTTTIDTLFSSLIRFKWKANGTINFVNEQKCTNYRLMGTTQMNETIH